MENPTPPPYGRSVAANRLILALTVAFAIALLLTGILTYVAVRDFVISWEMTSLPGITIQQQGAEVTPDASGALPDIQAPLQQTSGPAPEVWDGAERVTVLAMGLDYRDWSAGEGAPRTDTMMLLTLDPIGRTAGMLSIPRDLWVNIPGFSYGRINTAYSLGEAYKYPDGGGPGLAMATVEELLGVPIDYYVQIDFNAFVRFIDEIGGVKVDVKEKIIVDPLGDNNTKTLKPGRQTLPGDLALAYARQRKTSGGDFDRAARTQQVIMGIRDRIVRADMLPTLISKSPVLYEELSAGVHTNLSLEQTIKLAWLAVQIPEANIKQGTIGPPDQVLLVKSPEGDDVLKPITDKIRILRDDIFFDAQYLSPAAAGMSTVDLVKAEGAKLTVMNGTVTPGLAAITVEYLQAQGIPVANTGNADQVYASTTIYDYTGKIYTIKYLVELMKIQPNQIYSRYDPTSPADVVVILGTDWATSNPMP